MTETTGARSRTRRNGKDTDIYIMNPADPTTDRLVLQLNGGGWVPTDWSPDESQLLVTQVVSINESHLYLLDVASVQVVYVRIWSPPHCQMVVTHSFHRARASP